MLRSSACSSLTFTRSAAVVPVTGRSRSSLQTSIIHLAMEGRGPNHRIGALTT